VADIVPLEFRAEGVVTALDGRLEAGMRVLIPRAAVARDVLPEELARMGVQVDVVEAYRTVQGDADGDALAAQLTAGKVDLITFTSSSTVTNLLAILGPGAANLVCKATVACIGPITASTCLDHGIKPDVIAEEFTIAGLVKAICDFYKEGSEC
jgi:uroporphyrinogen III methyltransferase/synthase